MLYLRLKSMNAGEFDDHLVTTLPEDAPTYSTVTLWLRQERIPRPSEPGDDLTGDPQVDETDQAILSALTIQRFESVRDIARLTCRSCSTVHSHAFTPVQGPSSSLDPTCLDTRAKAQSSQRSASANDDASSTAEALLA
jgi:hypothetical protein